MALMQNISAEDQKQLGESLVALQSGTMPETVKLRILVAYLMNAVGPDTLQTAVISLAYDLRPDVSVS